MAAQHIPYVIDHQTQDTIFQNGRFVDVMKVEFHGPAGIEQYVYVPISAFNTQTVDGMIQNLLAHTEAVHRLGAKPVNG